LTLSVKIEWFKSIESVELDLGDLTILLGPLAAGKSNILDVLGVAGRAKYPKTRGRR
jgi:predicted ATPase